MALTFKHPLTAIVVGPTTCGKTHFVFRLIDNASVMIQPQPVNIIYCYGERQQLFHNYSQIHFHQRLPDIEKVDG